MKRNHLPARAAYRTRQFLSALRARPSPSELNVARWVLSPAQLALFERMQPAEQAHSVQVLTALLAQEHVPPDLQVAALLHDAGKTRYPMRLWERVLVVLVKALLPGRARHWAAWEEGQPLPRWRRPFVVAAHHPAWSAEMATEAGCTPLTVAIILRHHDRPATYSAALEDQLLARLQSVDDRA